MSARSYLYVPGDRPDLFVGAFERGADALILDLEDSILHANKDQARSLVAEWIAGLGDEQQGTEVWVRVNSTPEQRALDLDALDGTEAITGVSIPKVDGVGALRQIEGEFGATWSVIALIESAAGLLAAPQIAKMPRVSRLALGEADLMADLGVMRTSPSTLAAVRMKVVVASAAAAIDPPIAPVSTDFRDIDSLRRSTSDLRDMGFGARSAIHPDQIPVINDVFTPSPSAVAEATRIVEAADSAAASGMGVFVDVDGRMVDEAIVRRARRQLEDGDRRSGADGRRFR
ncbi:MAG: CoA ester lyase [Acidimicrobiia bacterium]